VPLGCLDYNGNLSCAMRAPIVDTGSRPVYAAAGQRHDRRYRAGAARGRVAPRQMRRPERRRTVAKKASTQAWDLAEHEAQGYSGIVLGWARRRAHRAAAAAAG
jgi:hypothetical protein